MCITTTKVIVGAWGIRLWEPDIPFIRKAATNWGKSQTSLTKPILSGLIWMKLLGIRCLTRCRGTYPQLPWSCLYHYFLLLKKSIGRVWMIWIVSVMLGKRSTRKKWPKKERYGNSTAESCTLKEGAENHRTKWCDPRKGCFAQPWSSKEEEAEGFRKSLKFFHDFFYCLMFFFQFLFYKSIHWLCC